MKLIKIFLLTVLIVSLSGCTSNKGIEVLDKMGDLSIDYKMDLSFPNYPDETINCEFEEDYYECSVGGEHSIDSNSENKDDLRNSMIHLFLSSSDFEEVDGIYIITEQGKTDFVQRLPYFESLMDTGVYTTEEAITEALDGLGAVKITMSKDVIDTIEIFDLDGNTLMIFTFDLS